VSRSKEAELIAALYLYASRCWSEGDLPALRDMGFGRAEIEDLLAVHLIDLHRLADLHGHPLRVELDRAAFRQIVEHLREERLEEETLRALIRADASQSMMETLYGMGGHEYTGWRQVLDAPTAVGRTAEPDMRTAHRIWDAWKVLRGNREPEDVRGEEYLELHRSLGVPLRMIWMLVERWNDRGGPGRGSGSADGAAHDDLRAPRRAAGRASF